MELVDAAGGPLTTPVDVQEGDDVYLRLTRTLGDPEFQDDLIVTIGPDGEGTPNVDYQYTSSVTFTGTATEVDLAIVSIMTDSVSMNPA